MRIRPGHRTALGLLLVSAVAFSIYQEGFGNPFFYDDHHAILDNELIRNARYIPRYFQGEIASSGAFTGHFRPLPMLSFLANFTLAGLDPVGFRLVNFFLHLGCGLLVYLLIFRLLGAFLQGTRFELDEAQRRLGALLATAAFVLHPVNSLAILMVWKRTTLLAALPFLLAVWLFSRLRGLGGPAPVGRGARIAHNVGIVVAFALGLSSKETAITLPAVLLILEIWPRPGSGARTRSQWARVLPLHLSLWAMVALFMMLLFPEQISRVAGVESLPYLMAQAKAIWLYVGMVFWPNLIAAAYDVQVPTTMADPTVLLAGGFIVVALLGSLAWARRFPLLSFGVLWVLITLSPTSSFVPGPLLVDEDRTYLPFVVLWMGFGAGCAWMARGSRGRVAAVIGVSVILLGGVSLFSGARAITWGDQLHLWADALEKYPDSEAARVNLCIALSGKPARARDAVAACRHALKLAPHKPIAVAALARSLLATSRPREAKRAVDDALKVHPGDHHLEKIAGHLLWADEAPGKAIPHYLAALKAVPRDIETLVYFAKCHQEIGRVDEARKALRYILGRPIVSTTVQLTLADLLRELRGLPRAERIYRRLHSLYPSLPRPPIGLAQIAVARGRERDARGWFAKAEQLAHRDFGAMVRIARARLAAGHNRGAIRVLNKVMKKYPGAALAMAALATAHHRLGHRQDACRLVARLLAQKPRSDAAIRLLGPLRDRCSKTGRAPPAPPSQR